MSAALPPLTRRLLLAEIGLLILAAPFLVFPTVVPALTWVAGALIIAVWLAQRVLVGMPVVPASPLTLALVLWVITIGVGIAVSADPDLTFPKATNLFLGLAVWRLLAALPARPDFIRAALGAHLLVGSGLAAVGALGTDWSFKVPWLTALVERLPTGLVALPESPAEGVHPNQLAGVFVFYLPVLLALLADRRPLSERRRVLPLLALLLAGAAGLLLLTQSRSGWVAALATGPLLLAGWATVLPPSRRRRNVWLLLATLGAGAVLLATQIDPARLRRLWEEPPRESVVGTLTSLSVRQETWRWAVVAAGDFPLTGTGLGTFRRVVYRLYPIQVPIDYDLGHAHNTFMQVALDTGVPGLIAYGALLAAAVAMAWRTARRGGRYRPIALALGVALVAIHIYGLAETLAPGHKNGLCLWLTLGVLTLLHRAADPDAAAAP